MRRLLTLLTMTMLVAFLGGYFYGRAVPQIIYFTRDQAFQEVRDDYYHKCREESSVVLKNGSIEQQWSCSKKKLFLLRRYVQKVTEVNQAQPQPQSQLRSSETSRHLLK